MKIGEKMTFLTYHENKRPKVLKYDSFILPLGEITHRKKNGDLLVMRKILIWPRSVLPLHI